VRRVAETDTRTLVGLVVAGLGAIAVAVLLVPLRDDIDTSNLALILVLVVVIAAIVGHRLAAALAAVVATMAFDFFLVRPYLSMRIDSRDDIETALILLVVGLLVGEVAERGRRFRSLEQRSAAAISAVHGVAEAVAQGAPLPDVARHVIHEIKALLQLHDCWLEFRPFGWPLPRLERAGTIDMPEHRFFAGGYALPQDGLELPVLVRGDEVARLVLLGNPDVTVSVEERVTAVALADQLGAAIAMAPRATVEQLGKELHAS
jgi:hypothetical protein